MKTVKQYRHSMGNRIERSKARSARYAKRQRMDKARVKDLEASYYFQMGLKL